MIHLTSTLKSKTPLILNLLDEQKLILHMTCKSENVYGQPPGDTKERKFKIKTCWKRPPFPHTQSLPLNVWLRCLQSFQSMDHGLPPPSWPRQTAGRDYEDKGQKHPVCHLGSQQAPQTPLSTRAGRPKVHSQS